MLPYVMSLAALEQTLYVLYATPNLDDDHYAYRADLARAYHDRTGRYFAARFYN